MKTTEANIIPYDLYAKKENMFEEVLNGLRSTVKKIPSKYLYDEKGSELFERITEQVEYYPARTEIAILETYKAEIAHTVGPVSSLIEYGSGSSKKIKTLLNALHSLEEYIPIDISKDFLFESCLKLSLEFPHLKVKAVCGDYTYPLNLPLNKEGRKVVFFPGSTIGNFEPDEVSAFLHRTFHLLESGDGFIIGVDLKKDATILHEAYNDPNGITAEFNLNLLNRINRELHGNFQIEQFQHKAFYNNEKGKIEMHIQSLCDQTVNVGQEAIRFRKGEMIHTENSYKYSVQEFQTLIQNCGFSSIRVWTDREELFSVHYIEKS
ncbi:L-histidine N(alpha)-methyltransferase [Domibacillus epiphyticus]|uniref:Dimethylhistidine N-methyltransferase n=1 Tax=Domibacillus epiphyticus TaxID=1714355 RepID=A0A1V2A5T0_9BACI|nr:L-histidine N(alpha)-methyltransferase [Domibacillus epiphyticus]OMP66338.1 dimethylhistidine N-methyltransferase [Domibacillus epiphyticus]